MKKIIYTLSFSLLVLTVIDSCKKADDVTAAPTTTTNYPVVPKQGEYTNLQDFFKSYIPSTKEVMIDASHGLDFFGNSGTHYMFPANVYQTASGDNVTGMINVAVTEYLRKSDMLFSGVLTSSDGDILESGGEAKVVVTQNGQKIFLKPGATFTATMPQDSVPVIGMDLFYGKETTINASKVNWKKAQQDSVSFKGIIYSGGDSIKLFSDSFGLVNIDRFMKGERISSGLINLSGVIVNNQSDIRAYMSVDGTKSLVYMGVKSENTISLSAVPKVPVHIIVMTIVNGYFYAGMLGFTPSEGITKTLKLEQIDAAEFKKQIDALK